MLCQSLKGGVTTITEHEAGAVRRSTSAGVGGSDSGGALRVGTEIRGRRRGRLEAHGKTIWVNERASRERRETGRTRRVHGVGDVLRCAAL